jgi:DNA-binding NarL/FixJ family response regulator
VSDPTCLFADDHPTLRVAISEFLDREGYAIVGPFADGRSAAEAAAAEQPTVAVVDYRMPQLGGASLVRELANASPSTYIVVYTAEADPALAEEALDAGASAVVLKEAPLGDLARALQVVRAGDTYVDTGLRRRDTSPPLTQREREVLQLVANGLTHESIATTLGIGAETVRTHLRKACNRLGASTRTQAVATAVRLGLID